MLDNRKNKVSIQVAVHIFIWLILSLFPYLLSSTDSPDFIRLLRFTWIPMVLYAIIFYLNYFYFIDKILFRQKIFLFVCINLSLIVFLTWVHFQARDLLNMISEIKPNADKPKPPPVQLIFYKDIISMMIPVIISITIKITEKWSKAETEKKEREKEILKSELQHLKYQLQPHFFFNSLNTIYALIERSPTIAQETVHNLSKLMRYLLYDTESGKVNLNDEIEFIKQYINLMKLRISDKTIVNVNLPALTEQYFVTPLLFISIIENAFKHGISATQNSEIFFSLSVNGKVIRFIAENKNFPKTESDKSGSGIGLNNLRKQLELSYPGKHNFKTKVEDSLFKVLLEINTD